MRASLCLIAVVLVVAAYAGLDGSYVLPLDHQAIQYNKLPINDRITTLQQKINSGDVKLRFDDDLGYLRSVLKALDVPVSSQVLVFSKTSFQAPRIGPRTPRAIYFGDDVTVGYVRGGDVLEFTAHDPKQGTVFYTLDQEELAKPRFSRQDQCLQCHASGSTLGVPGLVVRSVVPDRSGMPIFQAGTYVSDHRSPIAQRWGGWYVTGTHQGKGHMGNAVAEDKDKPDAFAGASNVSDLRTFFDTGAYASVHSDIVALMVLEHQVRMQNLLTRVGWEARMALHSNEAIRTALKEPEGTLSDSTKRRLDNAAEELVRYMLFLDEAPLEGEVRGTSGFTSEYSKRGPLYELDLKTRLYKHRCSPLIYSAAFDALPEEVRSRAVARLQNELRKPERKALRDILARTKPSILTPSL